MKLILCGKSDTLYSIYTLVINYNDNLFQMSLACNEFSICFK